MQDLAGFEALQLWGKVCSKQANCEKCPLTLVAGAGVSCQEFAAKYPKKLLSFLKELDKGELTYYEEYVTRMPYVGLSVDDLSTIMCRKVAFEGYVLCQKDQSECKACWQTKYTGDQTVSETEAEADAARIEKEQGIQQIPTVEQTHPKITTNNTAVDIITGILEEKK